MESSSVPVAVLVLGATHDDAAAAGERIASAVVGSADVRVFTLVDGDLSVVFTSGEEILETALCWLVARCPLVSLQFFLALIFTSFARCSCWTTLAIDSISS